MKKLKQKFAGKIMSQEQMKTVKGGTCLQYTECRKRPRPSLVPIDSITPIGDDPIERAAPDGFQIGISQGNGFLYSCTTCCAPGGPCSTNCILIGRC